MPRSADWWCADITKNLAQNLLHILPASGAWVDIHWLVCRTARIVPDTHASANYKRHKHGRANDRSEETTSEERCALGHQWLLIDALATHRKHNKIEWNGQRDDKLRRYRIVVPPPVVPEDLAVWVSDHEIRNLRIVDVRADDRVKVRVRKSNERIDQLVALYEQGTQLPSLVVVQEGDIYWLADGFHRLAARKRLNYPFVSCDVYPGTLDTAAHLAATANRDGEEKSMQMEPADKKKAAQLLLRHYPSWSNPRIAEKVGLTDKTVESLREEVKGSGDARVSPSETPNVTPPEMREGKDGKTYPATRTVTTPEERGGRARKVKKKVDEDGKSKRAAARELGISPEQASRDYQAASRELMSAPDEIREADLSPLPSKPTALDRLRQDWADATPAERDQFRKEIG